MARDRASRHRRARALAIVVGGLGILLVAARVALTPFVESRLRRSLDEMKGLRGTFDSLDLSVVRLSGTIHDLQIEKDTAAEGHRAPFFQAGVIEIGLYWKELFHGHLVGAVRMDKPKMTLVTSREPRNEQNVGEAPQLGRKLQEIAPFRLDRFEVRAGELRWIDAHVPERPELWMHGIEATLENFASRAALAKGEPSVLAVSGTLQRSGQVSIFASADPLAKGLTFAGQARLAGLELSELGDLLAATRGITPRHGTLDLSVGFRCVDGHLTGGVRPIVKNADVQQARPGLGARLRALLADLAIDVLSDRIPGRNGLLPPHAPRRDERSGGRRREPARPQGGAGREPARHRQADPSARRSSGGGGLTGRADEPGIGAEDPTGAARSRVPLGGQRRAGRPDERGTAQVPGGARARHHRRTGSRDAARSWSRSRRRLPDRYGVRDEARRNPTELIACR